MPFPDTPQRLLLTLAATAVAGLGLGAPAADAASPTTLSVLSPSDDALETGTVDIKVQVPAGATKVTARVAGKDVMLHGSGTVRTASIPVSKLRPGRASLAVRAKDKHGKPLFAHARVTVGTPAPSLLKGKPAVTQAHGTAALKLDFKVKPTKVQVTLNGKRVPLLRKPIAGATTLPLAADDGLRYGPNTLKLTAFDKGTGKWATSTARFTMSRKTPLASAGKDVRVTAGTKVKLSAAGSQARKDQVPLGYTWRIVSQPKGAKATLAGANTQKPTVKTTHPGRYRVQLQLTERAHGAKAASATTPASDTVALDAAASIPPYGTPITTLVSNGDGTSRTTIQGIPLNGGDDHVDTPDNKVGLIVLDRSTLGLDNVSQVNPDPGSILAAVSTVKTNEIAIMTGAPGCCSWDSTTGPIFQPGAGWTVIFAGGNYANPIASNNGTVTVTGATAGGMSGVIRKSHTLGGTLGEDVYTYAATDAIRFDTKIPDGPGFAMQLGSAVGTFGAGTGIAVMAVDPDLTTWGWNQFFPLTGDATADQATLDGLADKLNGVAQDRPGVMLMVQTNGAPKATTTSWAAVGDALTAFGGTASVFNVLDGTGDYALVGRSGAGKSAALRETASAEASGPLQAGDMNSPSKATAGTLRGVIGRGPDSMGIISGSSSLPTLKGEDVDKNDVQVNPSELTALAATAPQPWPASDAGSQQALQWISQQLNEGNPDVTGPGWCYQPTTWDLRADYCNSDDKDDWASTNLTALNGLAYPNSAQFTADQFNAVKTQLGKEFPLIARIFNMFTQLQAPIDGAQAQTVVDITDASTKVENSLNTNTAQSSNYTMQTFLSDFISPITSLPEPEAGINFGVSAFVDVVQMALSSVTDDDGNPAVNAFESDKTKIANDAVSRLAEAKDQLALVEQMILTDWTKLSTTAAYAENVWSLNDWVSDGQTDVVEASTQQWLYKTMVPLAYAQIAAKPSREGNSALGLTSITCNYNGGNGIEYSRWPFWPGAVPDVRSGAPSGGTPLPTSAAFAPVTGTAADGSPLTPFVWGLGNPTGTDSGLQTPSADLTDWLFKPLGTSDTSGNVGIGLYPSQLFSWGWAGSSNVYVFGTMSLDKLGDPLDCVQ